MTTTDLRPAATVGIAAETAITVVATQSGATEFNGHAVVTTERIPTPLMVGKSEATTFFRKCERVLLADGTSLVACTTPGCRYTASNSQGILVRHWREAHAGPKPGSTASMPFRDEPLGDILDRLIFLEREVLRLRSLLDNAHSGAQVEKLREDIRILKEENRNLRDSLLSVAAGRKT